MSFERDLPQSMRINDYLLDAPDVFATDVDEIVERHPDGDIIDIDVEFRDTGVFLKIFNDADLVVEKLIDDDPPTETLEAAYRAMVFAYQTMLSLPNGTQEPNVIGYVRTLTQDSSDVTPGRAFLHDVHGYLYDNPQVSRFIDDFSVAIHDSQYEPSTIKLTAGMIFMLYERAVGEAYTRGNLERDITLG